MHRHICNFVLMILVATLLAACGSADKGPAETALKAAEEAINSAKGEASKYMPDQLKSLESALAATREKLSKGDYKAVLSEAPALTSKAQEIASAAAAKKAELTKSWEGLSSGMPRVVEAIKSRVDILSQSKKLPAGMSAETLAQAKAGLSEITQQWTAATEASKGGNLMDAVAKASSVKVKAAEVLTLLKMPVPEALKG
ncbi:MAG TPA: hypothetical protein VLJ79_34305 [Candidatus Binatia bacterium]|nr:hypothetical protein [Candidatus Binatia bacterium]